jgi:hypothetical protein
VKDSHAGRKGRGRRRFDDELGGVRWVGGFAGGGVHSTPELDDGVEEEVRGDLHRLQSRRETPTTTGRKVGAKRRWTTSSSSHITPVLCASSSTVPSSPRYASPLSAIHVDLHRVGCRH